MPARFTIGQIAKEAGLRPSAIRFYEKAGLLPKPARWSGQRQYDRAVLDRLSVLQFAKSCGFTLAESRELLNAFRDEAPLARRLQGFAQRKIAELDTLAARLAAMKALLQKAQACQCVDLQECGRRLRESRRKK